MSFKQPGEPLKTNLDKLQGGLSERVEAVNETILPNIDLQAC